MFSRSNDGETVGSKGDDKRWKYEFESDVNASVPRRQPKVVKLSKYE